MQVAGRRRAGEGDPVDGPVAQGFERGGIEGSRRLRGVGHHLVHRGAGRGQRRGQAGAGDVGTQQQAVLAGQPGACGRRVGHLAGKRVGGETVGQQVGPHRQAGQKRFGGRLPHHRDADARQGPGVAAGRGQPVGQRVHRVDAGQHQPVVAPGFRICIRIRIRVTGQPPHRRVHRGPVCRRHQLQRGRLDHLGPGGPQPLGQPAGLVPRAGDQNPLSEQRAVGEKVQPRLVERRHGAHHDDRRSAQPRGGDGLGQGGQRATHGALPRQGAPLHRGGGRVGAQAFARQLVGDRRQPAHAHVEARGAAGAHQRGQPAVVHRGPPLGWVLVAGHDGHGAGGLAVRHRDTGGGRARDAGGHAGHDLAANAVRGQKRTLFGPATEKVGVAAFEADDVEALPGQVQQQLVGLVLSQFVMTCPLTHIQPPGRRRSQGQQGRVGQGVEDHRVGSAQQVVSGNRDQARVARPRADQKDGSGRRIGVRGSVACHNG